MSVPARGWPSAFAAWPCRSVNRAVTSSPAELITASAPTASAVSRREAMTSATTTCSTPRSFSQIAAPRPIGPAPKMTTLSPGFASDRLTACRATAIGSLRAATSNGTVSGKTVTLVPISQSSRSR